MGWRRRRGADAAEVSRLNEVNTALTNKVSELTGEVEEAAKKVSAAEGEAKSWPEKSTKYMQAFMKANEQRKKADEALKEKAKEMEAMAQAGGGGGGGGGDRY